MRPSSSAPVLSAGDAGLADRLVRTGFLLRTMGMVFFFFTSTHTLTQPEMQDDWSLEVILLQVLSTADVWEKSASKGVSRVRPTLNSERRTFAVAAFGVCQRVRTERLRRPRERRKERSSSASCVHDRK